MKVASKAFGADEGGRAFDLFVRLTTELESGQGDPETFFATHPAEEADLRRLHAGWAQANRLLARLASPGSGVRSALAELEGETAEDRCREVLDRVATGRPFAARYRLGDLVARGGMGVVLRVHDRLLGRDLAMKVIKEEGQSEHAKARLLRRFLAEAELTARLRHPSIVPVYDLGLDDQGCVYFTMPLVEGVTLENVFARVRAREDDWTWSRLIEVLLKVCDAVGYAHSRGVLHRDLKPGNVLVGEFGEVHVLDWGLARGASSAERPEGIGGEEPESGEDGASGAAEGLTRVGEVLGTPGYMAPEQVRREELDERADVYALGAILFHALAGRRPTEVPGRDAGGTGHDRIRRGTSGELVSMVPEAPAELVAIARKAMQHALSARYASVAEFAADLRAFVEGRVVSVHRSGTWMRVSKWVRRNPGLASLAAVAILGLGAAAGSLLVAHGSEARAQAEWRSRNRTELLRDLPRLRMLETAVNSALITGVKGTDAPPEIPSGVLQELRIGFERYLRCFGRHGVEDLGRDIPVLFRDAGPEQRRALLDDLYWLEIRLVLSESGAALLPEVGRLQAGVQSLIEVWEDRPWRRRLRDAWQRRRKGDVHAFESFLAELRSPGVSAEELEYFSILLSSAAGDDHLREVLERILELDPGNFWAHFRLTTLTEGEERDRHARTAVALDPGSAQAWYNVGWNCQNLSEPPFGKPEEAIHCYRKAIECEATPWETYLNLTYLVPVEEGIRLMQEAIEVKAIEDNPHGILYFRLAERCRSNGDCEKAIEFARVGVERFPDEPGIWSMLGECFGWLGRHEEAIAPLRRALELDPGAYAPRVNLMSVLSEVADQESDLQRKRELGAEMLALGEEGRTLFSEDPLLLQSLGIALFLVGRHQEAVALWVERLQQGDAGIAELLRSAADELSNAADAVPLIEEIERALSTPYIESR